VFSLVNV